MSTRDDQGLIPALLPTDEEGNLVETPGRTVETLEELVNVGICVSGAIAAGQIAFSGLDKLIGKIGVEPIDWLSARMRSDP